ncbi:MAG: hypothetical protein R2777_04290 [Chitinophagales bacterium]
MAQYYEHFSGGIPAQGSTPYIYTLADGTQAINNIFYKPAGRHIHCYRYRWQ